MISISGTVSTFINKYGFLLLLDLRHFVPLAIPQGCFAIQRRAEQMD